MTIEKITIPDFGEVQKITVVEVFISAGDSVEEEASLIALESEKAVMDIPSPFAGVITEVLVKEEDVVGSGDVIALIDTGAAAATATSDDDGEKQREQAVQSTAEKEEEPLAAKRVSEQQAAATAEKAAGETDKKQQPALPEKERPKEQVFHATPSVRALAREKQIDLAKLIGSGPNERILREDILAAERQTKTALSPQEPPLEDFTKYGEIEEVALGRIQKISGPQLHRSWITIPHVTHFDEADITELERFRKELNESLREDEPAYSPLVFVTKVVAATLREFPLFNSSLVPGGEKVILKKYYHLAIAVDTPKGLVVPVVKNADRRGVREIAAELKRLSTSARAGKLAIPDIQGATFTISSLGGIGGTGFTPIINSPQVAILGLSRSYMKPVWDGEQFVPRLTLPFSVSYDHRIIDGAEAARFCKALRMKIEDLKRALL
ncbi:biotin/lipoyl-binding protein [Desulfopila sp. IMCC35006]|uniref:2-oxo acid dehydrogenase subunit E2 n=1 Tax=Desulfopila sp. IMCC35006 TaxID=2569542 RepID=UPI0010AB644B|nr:2-oxo acid dehydrogenase subunit E2 [Desulfopila sp. IMCC35006]TKB25604.1 biotin/lipoyl-binding protein [Desulfopila sp. IMCC35006]